MRQTLTDMADVRQVVLRQTRHYFDLTEHRLTKLDRCHFAYIIAPGQRLDPARVQSVFRGSAGTAQ